MHNLMEYPVCGTLSEEGRGGGGGNGGKWGIAGGCGGEND